MSERDWERIALLMRATPEVHYDGSVGWTVEGRRPTEAEQVILDDVTPEDIAAATLLRAEEAKLAEEQD